MKLSNTQRSTETTVTKNPPQHKFNEFQQFFLLILDLYLIRIDSKKIEVYLIPIPLFSQKWPPS